MPWFLVAIAAACLVAGCPSTSGAPTPKTEPAVSIR